ncbi:hypothetical protein ACIO6U_02815 [Streptomyces sp. NPDC087422]|uniref:hypothetical protein n=1 Tax=Streptomyces sp. NPDC087422 TaxID=3365786 RepID=UPI0037FBC1E6
MITSRIGPHPVRIGFGLGGGGAFVVATAVFAGAAVVGVGAAVVAGATVATGPGLLLTDGLGVASALVFFFAGPPTVPMMNISTRNPTAPVVDHRAIRFRFDMCRRGVGPPGGGVPHCWLGCCCDMVPPKAVRLRRGASQAYQQVTGQVAVS